MLELSQQDEWAAVRGPVLEPLDSCPRGLYDYSVWQHHSYYIPASLRRGTMTFTAVDLSVLGQYKFRNLMRIPDLSCCLLGEFFIQITPKTWHFPAAVLDRLQWQLAQGTKRASPDHL